MQKHKNARRPYESLLLTFAQSSLSCVTICYLLQLATAVRPPHAMGVMHQVLAAQDSQGHGSESQHEMHQMQETRRVAGSDGWAEPRSSSQTSSPQKAPVFCPAASTQTIGWESSAWVGQQTGTASFIKVQLDHKLRLSRSSSTKSVEPYKESSSMNLLWEMSSCMAINENLFLHLPGRRLAN